MTTHYKYSDYRIDEEIGRMILRARKEKHQDISKLRQLISDLVEREVASAVENITHFNKPKVFTGQTLPWSDESPWDDAEPAQATVVNYAAAAKNMTADPELKFPYVVKYKDPDSGIEKSATAMNESDQQRVDELLNMGLIIQILGLHGFPIPIDLIRRKTSETSIDQLSS